jgi:glycosyltransferase involved in cell wall biosynthesis
MRKSDRALLVISERFFPEEFLVNDLVREWKERGYRVAVLTQSPSYPRGVIYPGYHNALYQVQEWNGIKVHRVLTVTGYRNSVFFKIVGYLIFAWATSLFCLLAGFRYCGSFVFQTGPLTQAVGGVVLSACWRRPMYIWTQDLWPDAVYAYGLRKTRVLDMLLSRFVRVVYRSSRKIFVSCRGFADKLSAYVPSRGIRYVPQWPAGGTELSSGKEVELEGGRIHFTFAGNIGTAQNLENVVGGFSLAVRRRKEIMLNIFGDGSQLEALQVMVEEQSVPNVRFWGRVPGSEIGAWLASSDVLVLSLADHPAYHLTVPAKLLAYLQVGKPILCAARGEVEQIVTQNSLGLSADPSDRISIAEAFVALAAQISRGTSRYDRNGRRVLTELFDRQKNIDALTRHVFGR